MAEDNAGVTEDSIAEGQAVEGQLDTGQAVDAQPDTGAKQDENKIPLSRLNEEIGKKKVAETAQKAAEQDAQLLRDQMAIIQANQSQAQVQTQVQQPKSTYEQAMLDCGVAESEYLTEQERTKVFARKEQLDMARNVQQTSQLANQQFIGSHSDYSEVVGVTNLYTGIVTPSTEITEILQRKPHLKAAAYASAQGAYEIVMDERKLKELTEESSASTEFEAQQKVDAKTGVMSSAAVGGSGAVDSGQLKRATTYEQQLENDQRVAAGQFDKK